MINGRIIYDDKILNLHNISNYRRSFQEERFDNYSVSGQHEAIDFGGKEGLKLSLQQVPRAEGQKMAAWWSWARKGNEFSFELSPSPDLVLNNDFNDDSYWTTGSYWTINTSIGFALIDGSQPGNTYLRRDDVLTDAKYYTALYTMRNRTAGSVRALMGSTGYGAWNSDSLGRYIDEAVKCSGDLHFRIQADVDLAAYIDQVWCFLSPGDVTLQNAETYGGVQIDMTTTPFSVGDKCLVRAADWSNYEIVEVKSVSDDTYVIITDGLKFSYAAGDVFRKLDYYPNVVMKPTAFELPLNGPGLYFNLDLEFVEINTS